MENVELLRLIDLLDGESRKAVETIVKKLINKSDPDYVKLSREEKRWLNAALGESEAMEHDELKRDLGW